MAAEIYPKGLFHLKHGYALWVPEPIGYDRVYIGDVGYVNEVGGFDRLFNITLPSDHESHTGLGVPDNFEPLTLPESTFRVVHSLHNFNEPIRSNWVVMTSVNLSIGASAGATGDVGFRFESTRSGGAALVLKSDADRHYSSAKMAMCHYASTHYKSWYQFANIQHGLGLEMGEIILVTGCDLTTGWAVAAFCREERDAGVSLDTGSLSVVSAQLSWSGKWGVSSYWQKRSGPDRPPEAGATVTGPARDPSVKNQCVFIQGFKIKARLGKAKLQDLVKLKAAAEPRDPDKGPDPHDQVGLVLEIADNASDLEVEVIPERSQVQQPLDILLDYILENSHAQVAIAHDDDWCALAEDFVDVADFAERVRSLAPRVIVDESGVGVLIGEPQGSRVTELEIQSHELPSARKGRMSPEALHLLASTVTQGKLRNNSRIGWEVEAIVDARPVLTSKREWDYFVKWKGHDSSYNSWVNEKDAGITHGLIEHYQQQKKGKETKRPSRLAERSPKTTEKRRRESSLDNVPSPEDSSLTHTEFHTLPKLPSSYANTDNTSGPVNFHTLPTVWTTQTEYDGSKRLSPNEALKVGLAMLNKESYMSLVRHSGRDIAKGHKILLREEGRPPINFQLGDRIGRGQFGYVYRALNSDTGHTYAVKRIPLAGLKNAEITRLTNELDVLKSLSHPSIVKYEGMATDSDTMNFILEYAENGSLRQILDTFGKLTEHAVAGYVGQILDGLQYLHKNNIVHCDLKAANILTTKTGQVKLSDFGISLTLLGIERETAYHLVGPNWMAPEVISLGTPSPASDIWSLACTMIELVTGQPPYADIASAASVAIRIVDDENPPIPHDYSKDFESFLDVCFRKDPLLRATPDFLRAHEWLQSHRAASDSSRLYTSSSHSSEQHLRDSMDTVVGPPLGTIPSKSTLVPSGRSAREMPLRREHDFVKTTFSKAIKCRVCNLNVKKSAVLCQNCTLIAHARCATNTLQKCDFLSQLSLSNNPYSSSTLPSRLKGPASSTTLVFDPDHPNIAGSSGHQLSPVTAGRPLSAVFSAFKLWTLFRRTTREPTKTPSRTGAVSADMLGRRQSPPGESTG